MANAVTQKAPTRIVKSSGSCLLTFNMTSTTLVQQQLSLYSSLRLQVIGQAYGLYRFTSLQFTCSPASSSYAFGVYTDEESGALVDYRDVCELPNNVWLPQTTTHCRSIKMGRRLLNQTQVRWFETQDVSSGQTPAYVAVSSTSAAGYVFVYCDYEVEFCQPIPPNLSQFRRPAAPESETRFTVDDYKVATEHGLDLDDEFQDVRSVKSVKAATGLRNFSTSAVIPRGGVSQFQPVLPAVRANPSACETAPAKKNVVGPNT